MRPVGGGAGEVDLAITGMTSPSCSARIEGGLNALEGVEASVDLVTGRARVRYAAPVTVGDVVAEVRRTGYGASVTGGAPSPGANPPRPTAGDLLEQLGSARSRSQGRRAGGADRAAGPAGGLGGDGVPDRTALLRRLAVSASLTVPVVLLAVVTPRTAASAWLQLALTTPIVLWAAWPFHRAAAGSARHRRAATHALVSAGTLALYVLSLVGLGTGHPELLSFDTAAVVTTLLLAGSLAASTARDWTGTARRPLRTWPAKDVAAADGVVIGGSSTLDAFVPLVLGISVLSLVGWLVTGHGLAQALPVFVAVLLVASPRALCLASPTALVAGTARAAELGILMTGVQVMQDAGRIDTVVLGKAGTVTSGEHVLVRIVTANNLGKAAALRAAAAVESGSEHPVARAIVAAAKVARLPVPPVTDFVDVPGHGAGATIKHTPVTVGRAQLFEVVPPQLCAAADAAGGIAVHVGWGGSARATFILADEVRESSAGAVRRLGEMGLTAYLLTGDTERSAREVGDRVGIPAERVIADVPPGGKSVVVQRLQSSGRAVAVVGDGVGDAAALAQADLGLATGAGPGVATASGGIVPVAGDFTAAVDALRLARATRRVVRQNLAWAFAYNALAIPLAALGLLNPVVAAAAMVVSSLVVEWNSLRLRAFRGWVGTGGPVRS